MRLKWDNLGKGLQAIGESITERRKREELAALGQDAVLQAGTGLQVTGPEGQTSTGLLANMTPEEIKAAQQAYEAAGYTATPTAEPMYAARAGSRDIGVYGTEAEAKRAARAENVGLMQKRADIYGRAGEDQMAENLRARAGAAELQGLQIEEAQAKADSRMRVDAASTAVNNLIASGKTPTMADLQSIAATNKLTMDEQYTLGSRLTGINENEAKMTKMDIEKKIKGQGLDGLLKLHKDDPTFDDNSYFEKSVGKDGKITLTQMSNDGRTMGSMSFKSADEATAYLKQQATDPGNVFTWLQASRAKEAGISKDIAQTNLATAQAGNVGRDIDVRKQSNLLGLAEQFRKQRSDIDTQLINTSPTDPNYRGLIAQRNEVNRNLQTINAQLMPPQTGGLAKQPAAPSGVDAALEVAKSGKNPNTGKPFTAAEKKDFEKVFGIPFPETAKAKASETPKAEALSPAAKIRQASGLAPRIPGPPAEFIYKGGRGGGRMKNPEYEKWEKQYGEAYRNQQR